MNSISKVVLKWIALTAVLFVAFSLAAVVSGVAGPQPSPPAGVPGGTSGAAADAPSTGSEQAAGALSVVLLCALVSGAFSWAIVRSTAWGLRLVFAVLMACYGLGTFLPQIESALFLPRHLPPGFVTRLFVMGAITAVIFAPAPVLIWGRHRPPAAVTPDVARPRLPARSILVRTALLAAVYVAVYLLAGYFIAFRNPEVLAYYNDTDPGSFAAQVSKIWATAPWFFGFQFARGVLWVMFVLPLIAWFRGRRLESALLVACLFTAWVVMLLAPNPYMPASVRMTHLVETTCSNLLFGALVGAVLARGTAGSRSRITGTA
jgi:hypothetical protein